MLGISKRELMRDYYPDELEAVFGAWRDMQGYADADGVEPVSVNAFLDM